MPAITLVANVLKAAPRTPIAGTGPQPNTSSGHSSRWIAAVTVSIMAGSSMLPVPRTMADSRVGTQMVSAPPNSTSE